MRGVERERRSEGWGGGGGGETQGETKGETRVRLEVHPTAVNPLMLL